MADNLATQLRNAQDLAVGMGDASNLKTLVATMELSALAALNDTITFGVIPTTARIVGASQVAFDDLGTTGALDVGLFAVNGNITDDDDAFVSAADVTTAGTSALVADIADYGKQAWEFVNGQTTDPGGVLTVRGTFSTATTTGGTVNIQLLYYVD